MFVCRVFFSWMWRSFTIIYQPYYPVTVHIFARVNTSTLHKCCEMFFTSKSLGLHVRGIHVCGIHSQDIAPDWWRRMAYISMDCPSSLPGIPQSVLSVPMENKYKCQQCHQVLRKPVQAQCGHRFCVHCFKQLTRYTGGPQTLLTLMLTLLPDMLQHILSSYLCSPSGFFVATKINYFTQTHDSHDWTLLLSESQGSDPADSF